ncbi:hypothetical protein JKP88DRAFT_319209 [Tribonema minus]|uniref:SET domain-containing protein n=1 Tax=Tribonema minus TaxID=303371 RepID=A0A835YW27_9STRA|nr:hypothetical protein JKP88DRAFT_319209 [Tribonema minus]
MVCSGFCGRLLQLLLVLSPLACTSAGPDDAFAKFESWLRTNGATIGDVEFKSQNGLRGGYANKDLKVQDVILEIPQRLLITADMGKTETDTGKAMLAALEAGDLMRFERGLIYTTVYVLTDRVNPNSSAYCAHVCARAVCVPRYLPFYNILPADYDNMPITWGPDKLAWLEGSYARVDAQHQQSSLRRAYDWILRVHPPFANLATFEEFTWAYAVARSRTFGVDIKGTQGGVQEALVPFADMFNHWLPCSVATGWSKERGVFSLRARAQIAAGEEICTSYGQRQKRDFLQSFGFILEDNFEKGRCIELVGLDETVGPRPGDCEDDTELEFTIDADDAEVTRKLQLLRAMPTTWHPGGPFWSIEPGAHGSVRVAMNGRREGAFGNALTLARIACANAQELTDLESRGWQGMHGRLTAALNSQNEACALGRLVQLTEAYIHAFPTTLEEDVELFNSGTLAPYSERRNALVVVMTDKRMLDDILDLVDGALLCLPQADRQQHCYSIDSEEQRRWDVVVGSRPAVRELLQVYCGSVAAAVAYREECHKALHARHCHFFLVAMTAACHTLQFSAWGHRPPPVDVRQSPVMRQL